MMCATEKSIRECAARGLSQKATRAELGLPESKFRLLVQALPDLTWQRLKRTPAPISIAPEVEQFIRRAAKQNWSRTQTRDLLGIPRGRFEKMLALLTDVVWPSPGQCVTHAIGRERQRGVRRPEHVREKMRIKRKEQDRVYTVNGRKGTLPDLAQGAPVCAGTIRRRLREGMAPAIAFTKPPQDHRRHAAQGSSHA